VTFSGNSAASGGAMWTTGDDGVSSPVMINVTFAGNTATGHGGAIAAVATAGVSIPISPM